MLKFKLLCALFSPPNIFDLNPTLISPEEMRVGSEGTGGPVQTDASMRPASPGTSVLRIGKCIGAYSGSVTHSLCINSNFWQHLQHIFNYNDTPLSQMHTEPLPNLLQADVHSKKTTRSQNWTRKWVTARGNFRSPILRFLSSKVANWTLIIQIYLFAPSVRSARFIFSQLVM